MNKRSFKRGGWNWYAFFFSIIWYFKNGIIEKALIMLVLTIFSLGVGIIPISIYAGIKGNQDRYNQSIKKFTI